VFLERLIIIKVMHLSVPKKNAVVERLYY